MRQDDKKLPALNLYVDLSGEDDHPGTEESPFKTVYRAQEEVRQQLKKQELPICVYLREGTHYLGTPLVFTPRDSGTAAKPVTYGAYPGEKVVLSGGIKLKPAWEPYRDGIQRTGIGAGLTLDQVFLNGKRQQLARYPDYAGDAVILGGYGPDCLSAERTARWKNSCGGLVRGLEKRMWGGNSYRIKGVKNGEAALEWAGDNNRGQELHTEYRMVENVLEELDAPGEWYYDRDTGLLYFYPPKDVDLEKAVIEAACLEELIRIEGTVEHRVSYLTFDGFIFTHTHRTLFNRPYEGLLRGDWAVARVGAVFVENAENITLQNSLFDQVGGNAVCISGYNRGHRIHNNDFTGAGASCVLVAGLPGAVRCPSTWENHRTDIPDMIPGPLTEDYPAHITISNNHMYNLGVFEKQTAGVCLSMCEDITVRRNTIHHSPRSGININDGCWGGHVIEYNDVFDCVRESGDHGPFNAWGRDRYWSYTGFNTGGAKGGEKRPYALLDAWRTTIIRNNRFHADGSWGIDLDDGSSNYEIYNNLCLNMGFKLREGFFRRVYNNIILHGRGNFHVSFAKSDDRIERNIIVNSCPYDFIRADTGEARTGFDYNLFWNYGRPVENTGTAWKAQGQDQHSRIGDPLFENPAVQDYRVKPGSPALDIGFVNFPMDCFGKPGCPVPPPVYTQSAEKEKPDPANWMGAVVTGIYSEGIRSAAGIGDCHGVYIYELPFQCTAERLGFRQGDVIREVNGAAVTTRQYLLTEYPSIPEGSVVTVIRNQRETLLPMSGKGLPGTESQ